MRLEIKLVLKPERKVPASVYLIADHLDAALASGEDLLRLRHELVPPGPQAASEQHLALSAELRRFVERVRTLEMVIAARVLQARQRAVELKRADTRFKPVVGLFIAGTNALGDAIEGLGDSTRADFQSGEQATVYLRARAVIPADAAGLGRLTALTIGEDFLVAERIRLGELLDLAATFLDALDLHYELYAEPDIGESADEAA